ncbi:hypothetical protein ACHAW5_008974 [Stephanodiscus triporus]|uniref:UVR domain-containing protein n=1 Tax=Stephanodiscus triporus TaxID=2934178 RepID=A0ABD3NJ90_9STRA
MKRERTSLLRVALSSMKRNTRFKSLVQKFASYISDSLTSWKKLKPLLPKEQELNSDLARTMAEIESAIQNKNFDKAEKLHEIADDIERMLAVEGEERG